MIGGYRMMADLRSMNRADGHSLRGALFATVLLSVAVGAASAYSPLTLGIVVATAAVAVGAAAPPLMVVAAEVSLRNFSDPLAAATVGGAGLNASAGLGLWIIAVAGIRIAKGRATPPSRWVLGAFGLYVAWILVGIAHFGTDASLVREAVRAGSVVALYVVAVEARRASPTAWPLLATVVASGVVPAIIALATGGSFGEEESARATATFSHPNAAADLFATDLSIALTLALGYWPEYRRWCLGAAAILAGGLLASGSIGGLAQGAAAGLFVVLIGGFSTRVKFLALGGLVVVGLVFVTSPLGAGRLAELSTTTSFQEARAGLITNSLDWRFLNWSLLLDAWHQYPWLGWGAGATSSLLTPLGAPPHNDYVRLLVEMGVIGVALFVGFSFALARKTLARSRDASAEVSFAAKAFAAVAVGVAVNALGATPTLRTTTMFACVCSLAATSRGREALTGVLPRQQAASDRRSS